MSLNAVKGLECSPLLAFEGRDFLDLFGVETV